MPRKTKEAMEENKDVKKKSTTAKKSKKTASEETLAENFISTVEEVTEKATSKKSASKTSKKETEKATKKATTKKTSKSTKTSEETDVVEVAEEKKKTTKKASTKKASTKTSKTKTSSKKSTKKSDTTESEKKPRKRKTTKTTEKEDVELLEIDTLETAVPMEVEYYDLPYKYNQTVVKVLYQNPTTLFVYWEISDDDIERYKRTYGEYFFESTEPILTVYNDTMNYKFEILINDFANSWYFTINDSKCHYHVELGRRPRYNNFYTNNYVFITSSNTIESPNDRILFNTNENNSVYFKNIKNNTYRKVELPKLIAQLNLNNKQFGFPLIKDLPDLYKNIYQVEDMSEFETLSNPSSGGNPSSGSLSSRFK